MNRTERAIKKEHRDYEAYVSDRRRQAVNRLKSERKKNSFDTENASKFAKQFAKDEKLARRATIRHKRELSENKAKELDRI